MPPLMLHHRDPQPVRVKASKINDVGKPSHQTSTIIGFDDHPPLRSCGEQKYLPLKLINETVCPIPAISPRNIVESPSTRLPLQDDTRPSSTQTGHHLFV